MALFYLFIEFTSITQQINKNVNFALYKNENMEIKLNTHTVLVIFFISLSIFFLFVLYIYFCTKKKLLI